METAQKLNAIRIKSFAKDYIEKGSTISSDGSDLYPQLSQDGYNYAGKVYNHKRTRNT